MKNKQKRCSLLTFSLILFLTINGYSQDLLNPPDSYGKNWFENQTQKNIFLTGLFSKMKSAASVSGTLKSVNADAMISLIKADVDLTDNNGNEKYNSLIVIKGNDVSTDMYSSTDNNNTARYPLMINLYVGPNFTGSSYTVSQNIPGGDFGTILVDDDYTYDLTGNGSDKGGWLTLNDGLQMTLTNLLISGN